MQTYFLQDKPANNLFVKHKFQNQTFLSNNHHDVYCLMPALATIIFQLIILLVAFTEITFLMNEPEENQSPIEY
jgi:hypothetical protein